MLKTAMALPPRPFATAQIFTGSFKQSTQELLKIEGQAWWGILNVLSSYIKQILLSAEIPFQYDNCEPDQPLKVTGKGLEQL